MSAEMATQASLSARAVQDITSYHSENFKEPFNPQNRVHNNSGLLPQPELNAIIFSSSSGGGVQGLAAAITAERKQAKVGQLPTLPFIHPSTTAMN